MSSEKNTVFKLRLSAKASKYLLRLNKKTAKRLLDKMEILKQNPLNAKGIKPLAGKFAGLYRLRIGNYRVIYQIKKDDQIVIILVIGHRGDVYSKGF